MHTTTVTITVQSKSPQDPNTVATVLQRMINTNLEQAKMVANTVGLENLDDNQQAGLEFLTTSTFTVSP